MKKITFLIFLLSITIGYSQQQTYSVTFESGSTLGTWTTFENSDGDNALEIIANPVSGGINTSATVAKFTAKSAANGGQPWAGTQTNHGTLGTWLLETGNNSISIMVYKPVISDVGIKFVNSTNGTIFELKKPNTQINTWETITFDISAAIASGENHDIDRLVVFPDWPTSRSQDNVCYFDNVTWDAKKTAEPGAGGSTGGADPTTEAPTPTIAAANVISIYSDAYTPITGVNYNPGWGQSTTYSEITINTNHALKYANLNYQGTDFAGNPQDVSSMNYVHLDYYTTDATALQFFLINDPNNGGANEKAYDIAATDGITLNSWVSKDIPLTHFSGLGLPLNAVFQFKVVGNGTVYLDNLYFSTQSTLAVKNFELLGLNVYPNPTNNNWVVSSKNDEIISVDVFDLLGRNVIALKPNKKEVLINASRLATGVYLSKITTEKGTTSRKLIKN